MTKRQTLSIVLKIIYTLIVVAILIGIIIVAFVMRGQWNIFSVGFADVGVYGLVIFIFLCFQQLFSTLNNKWWIPKLVKMAQRKPVTSIQAVGYREDPLLFRSCLVSLSQQDYENFGQILVGIDGNQKQDLQMQQTFSQVFPNGFVLRLQKVFKDMDPTEQQVIRDSIKNEKYVCISQPHMGKRDIMYTCFHLHSEKTEHIALTDSDTIWAEDTLTHLVEVMEGHDEYRKEKESKNEGKTFKSNIKECGAVTGDVRIWNKQNYLCLLSAVRYWFAFNAERSADSFFGVVNCVSGPLGLYKKELIQDISIDWIEQSFMGEKCTFGDDRALSNRVLQRGKSIFYTPLASCDTDTPAQLLRWIAQQTRWSKSFYREFVYNIKSFHKHSVWMSVELVFQVVYPLFILTTLVYFMFLNIDILMIVFSFIVMMGTIRACFGLFRTCKLQFLHYTNYVFLYIFFLIPCKLWALLTVWNGEWGTSSRSKRTNSIMKAIHALVWAVCMAAAIIFFIVYYFLVKNMDFSLTTAIVAASCLAYVLALGAHWLIWGTYFLIPEVRKLNQDRYTEDEKFTRSNMTNPQGTSVSGKKKYKNVRYVKDSKESNNSESRLSGDISSKATL